MLATVLKAGAETDPDKPEDTARHAEGRQALGDDLPPEDWPVRQPDPGPSASSGTTRSSGA